MQIFSPSLHLLTSFCIRSPPNSLVSLFISYLFSSPRSIKLPSAQSNLEGIYLAIKVRVLLDFHPCSSYVLSFSHAFLCEQHMSSSASIKTKHKLGIFKGTVHIRWKTKLISTNLHEKSMWLRHKFSVPTATVIPLFSNGPKWGL